MQTLQVRWSSSVIASHLQSLSTEDILVQGGDQDLRQMVNLLVCFFAALLHAAGHALQRLRQLFLQACPLGVGGAVLLQLIQILCAGDI